MVAAKQTTAATTVAAEVLAETAGEVARTGTTGAACSRFLIGPGGVPA
jgi:hypothetical protein